MQKITKEIYMYIMGGVIIISFVGTVIALMLHAVPPDNINLVNIALGAELAMAGNVVSYFFGSSKGSADKTDLLAQAPPIPTKPEGV